MRLPIEEHRSKIAAAGTLNDRLNALKENYVAESYAPLKQLLGREYRVRARGREVEVVSPKIVAELKMYFRGGQYEQITVEVTWNDIPNRSQTKDKLAVNAGVYYTPHEFAKYILIPALTTGKIPHQ